MSNALKQAQAGHVVSSCATVNHKKAIEERVRGIRNVPVACHAVSHQQQLCCASQSVATLARSCGKRPRLRPPAYGVALRSRWPRHLPTQSRRRQMFSTNRENLTAFRSRPFLCTCG